MLSSSWSDDNWLLGLFVEDVGSRKLECFSRWIELLVRLIDDVSLAMLPVSENATTFIDWLMSVLSVTVTIALGKKIWRSVTVAKICGGSTLEIEQR